MNGLIWGNLLGSSSLHFSQWYVILTFHWVLSKGFTVNTQVGKTSAFIGPFVSSAIITASGNNNNMPFAFLFGLYVPFLYTLD